MKLFLPIIFTLISFSPYSAQNYEPFIEDFINQTNLDSLITIVRILSGEDSVKIGDTTVVIRERVSASGKGFAADYIKQKLESFGLETIDQIYSDVGRNVIAIQPGSNLSERYFIICAHYDAVTEYCADDNASGVATVLEAARILADYTFSFSIVYALWDHEEIAYNGSEYYASQAYLNQLDIQGVLNLDMLAWDGNNDGIFEIHMKDRGNSNFLANLVFNVDSIYSLPLNPVIYNPGTSLSDQRSFWGKNWGAILLIEAFWGDDFNPYYHSNEDRIGEFNLSYFHNMAKLSVGSLATMAYFEYPLDRVHPYNLYTNRLYYKPVQDSILITSHVNNPQTHNVQLVATIENVNSGESDSTFLYDDGNQVDSLAADGIYSGWLPLPTTEDIFSIKIRTNDLDLDYHHILPARHSRKITTIGPVIVNNYELKNAFATRFTLRLSLKNEGLIATANVVKAEIINTNQITNISQPDQDSIAITAGATVDIEKSFGFNIEATADTIPIVIKIYSNEYHFWNDTIYIDSKTLVSITDEHKVPATVSLSQNYPNPFNPITIINYSISNQSNVLLKVYDLLGREVAILVNKNQQQGNYEVEFDGSELTSGIYIYRLQVYTMERNVDFVESKKLVLLK